jgi:hypothetical protein
VKGGRAASKQVAVTFSSLDGDLLPVVFGTTPCQPDSLLSRILQAVLRARAPRFQPPQRVSDGDIDGGFTPYELRWINDAELTERVTRDAQAEFRELDLLTQAEALLREGDIDPRTGRPWQLALQERCDELRLFGVYMPEKDFAAMRTTLEARRERRLRPEWAPKAPDPQEQERLRAREARELREIEGFLGSLPLQELAEQFRKIVIETEYRLGLPPLEESLKQALETRDHQRVIELATPWLERLPASMATFPLYERVAQAHAELGQKDRAANWARKGISAMAELLGRPDTGPEAVFACQTLPRLYRLTEDADGLEYERVKALLLTKAQEPVYRDVADVIMVEVCDLEYAARHYDRVFEACDRLDAWYMDRPKEVQGRMLPDWWRGRALHKQGKTEEGAALLDRLVQSGAAGFKSDPISHEASQMRQEAEMFKDQASAGT